VFFQFRIICAISARFQAQYFSLSQAWLFSVQFYTNCAVLNGPLVTKDDPCTVMVPLSVGVLVFPLLKYSKWYRPTCTSAD